MTLTEFDATDFRAYAWVNYNDQKYYVISISFPERLLVLTKEKANIPADEWSWVRCENVQLLNNEVINFPKTKK